MWFFFYFCIFWWGKLNEFHFCLKIAYIEENKLFYRINERNVSILWSKDSKMLMGNGKLCKICCKKVIFLIFGCHGNRSRSKNDLQLPLIVFSTFDKDIWVKKIQDSWVVWNNSRNKLLWDIAKDKMGVTVAMETGQKSHRSTPIVGVSSPIFWILRVLALIWNMIQAVDFPCSVTLKIEPFERGFACTTRGVVMTGPKYDCLVPWYRVGLLFPLKPKSWKSVNVWRHNDVFKHGRTQKADFQWK